MCTALNSRLDKRAEVTSWQAAAAAVADAVDDENNRALFVMRSQAFSILFSVCPPVRDHILTVC